ncbi:MAG: tetratricopeptide repeat protein [Flavobacteriales bacterium]|nr:tetratricopeptide repeat protein [Flavobacteriales bacterium]
MNTSSVDAQEEQSVRTIEELNVLILKNPNSVELYLQRAAIHRAENSLNEAFNDVNRALSLDSLSSEAQFELGSLHYMVGNMGEAKFALESAIELDPANTEAMLELAELYFVLTNHNRSMRMINDALKVDEQLTKGYFLKGLIYKEQNNYELAKSSLQTVTELDPDHVEAFNLLGMLHAADGDSLALQYYETALAIDSTNLEVLYNRGYFYQDRLMAEEALQAYNKMLDHHPGSAVAHFNKGYVLMGLMSEPEKAIDSFTEAIRYNPQYYQAYSNRAVCLEELGRKDQAISDYEMALEIFPNFEPAVLGMNRLN